MARKRRSSFPTTVHPCLLAGLGRLLHRVAMKILLVGAGGREHALARKIAEDDPTSTLWCAPGNPGTGLHATNVPIPASDVPGLLRFAREEAADLTVVGPEQPLAEGLADAFAGAGLAVFGPTAAAAQIEASKAFAKVLMRDEGVPTAAFSVFREVAPARRFAAGLDPPVVVKASGLAGGKGAIICDTHADAERVIVELLEDATLGEAGAEIVIEEFMRGPELSVFFLADGHSAVPFASARDHKRRFEGDRGPNTGGMGAFSPVPEATPELIDRVRRDIAEPVLASLAARGTPYRGILYAGLMLTQEGPRVVEFNCRLGDPEAQVVLPRMTGSLLEAMDVVGRGGRVDGWDPGTTSRSALTTVVVSGTYPGPVSRGLPIDLPSDLEGPDLHVYHAGTATVDGRLVTAGGRVFGVTGLGDSVAEAGARSRAGAARIGFDGAAWRGDIGRSSAD